MSLGINMLRRPQQTNLPGAVGGNMMSTARRRARPAMSPPKAASVPALGSARRVTVESVLTAPVASPADKPPLHLALTAQLYDEMQWVYATATAPLTDADSGEEIAEVPVGSRVLLVYPMQTREADRVCMRLKSVHPVTGQLRLRWVVVYDPETEARPIGDFAVA
jgi:hypothetical protein